MHRAAQLGVTLLLCAIAVGCDSLNGPDARDIHDRATHLALAAPSAVLVGADGQALDLIDIQCEGPATVEATGFAPEMFRQAQMVEGFTLQPCSQTSEYHQLSPSQGVSFSRGRVEIRASFVCAEHQDSCHCDGNASVVESSGETKIYAVTSACSPGPGSHQVFAPYTANLQTQSFFSNIATSGTVEAHFRARFPDGAAFSGLDGQSTFYYIAKKAPNGAWCGHGNFADLQQARQFATDWQADCESD